MEGRLTSVHSTSAPPSPPGLLSAGFPVAHGQNGPQWFFYVHELSEGTFTQQNQGQKIVLNLCPSTHDENIQCVEETRHMSFPVFRLSEGSFSWTPSCPAEWVGTFHGPLYGGSE